MGWQTLQNQVLMGSQAKGRGPADWVMTGLLLPPAPKCSFMALESLKWTIWDGGFRGQVRSLEMAVQVRGQ